MNTPAPRGAPSTCISKAWFPPGRRRQTREELRGELQPLAVVAEAHEPARGGLSRPCRLDSSGRGGVAATRLHGISTRRSRRRRDSSPRSLHVAAGVDPAPRTIHVSGRGVAATRPRTIQSRGVAATFRPTPGARMSFANAWMSFAASSNGTAAAPSAFVRPSATFSKICQASS